MKKLVSLLICLCMLVSVLPVIAAEPYIELNPLKYDEYMRGETIFVSGNTNIYVTLGLYAPEEAGGGAKFIMIYSPSEFLDGVTLETGHDASEWPDGIWKITVQSNGIEETLEFSLSETVDRTEDDFNDGSAPPTDPDKPNKPSGNGTTQVVLIKPEKTKLTLSAGESEKINIETSASSLSLEIEDEKVIDASISGKTLTVTALRVGTSAIWVKGSNNYADIKVTVTPQAEKPTEESTEEPTEKPTEEPTEKPTEEPTEEPTEKPTEIKPLPFKDVQSHWAKEDISILYNLNIVNGMDDVTFAPENPVTRAQFVTMLAKAFNLDSKSTISPFRDVKSTDWYFESVMAAFENGITKGDEGNNFNPGSLITRQDMATLAYRAAKAAGKEFKTDDPVLFDDHASISAYAVESVYAMRSASVINGMSEDIFEPLGNATRAQAARIISRLISLG